MDYDSSGAELIAAERQRQISVEGWTAEHDDCHYQQEMAKAALSYLHYVIGFCQRQPPFWPFLSKWWKPDADPIRNLVKAGALIAAEIDRIQRLRG